MKRFVSNAILGISVIFTATGCGSSSDSKTVPVDDNPPDNAEVDPDSIPGGEISTDDKFSLDRLGEYNERDVLLGLAKNVSIPTHEQLGK